MGQRRFRHTYTDQANLTFRFKSVPIGRYLLISNPEGPQSDGSPFESTYYPLNKTRANTEVIEVKSAGVHLGGMDLKVGERAEFRRVTVRVRFPDGVPMKTAGVRCLGLPRGEGEAVWSVAGAAGKDGAIKLMIYGRDLKGTDSSLHEPGSAPITQEFVVIP